MNRMNPAAQKPRADILLLADGGRPEGRWALRTADKRSGSVNGGAAGAVATWSATEVFVRIAGHPALPSGPAKEQADPESGWKRSCTKRDRRPVGARVRRVSQPLRAGAFSLRTRAATEPVPGVQVRERGFKPLTGKALWRRDGTDRYLPLPLPRLDRVSRTRSSTLDGDVDRGGTPADTDRTAGTEPAQPGLENPTEAAPATAGQGFGDDLNRLPDASHDTSETNQRVPARHAGNSTTTPTRSTAMTTMETVETKKTKHISRRFRRFFWANEAVAALEYAILVGVIAVAIGAALVTFGDTITTALGTIGGQVEEVDTGVIVTEGAADP